MNSGQAAIHLVDKQTANITGALTFATVPQLRVQGDKLIDSQESVTFDFQNVSYSDSFALPLLTAWLRHARRLNKTIHFVNLPNNLLSVAKVSGIDKLLALNGM